MIIRTIDDSQRKAAKVAGFAYLFGLAAVLRPSAAPEPAVPEHT
jgi:hypothetical protein